MHRGYEASRTLQATHDEAVHIRTNLRLTTESEEQEQVLQEFKLKREKERTKLSKLINGVSWIGCIIFFTFSCVCMYYLYAVQCVDTECTSL